MTDIAYRRIELFGDQYYIINSSEELYVTNSHEANISLLVDLREQSEDANILINLRSDAKLKLILFTIGNNNSYNLEINLDENAHLDLYTADYLSNTNTNKTINLNGEGAEANTYEFSSSSKDNSVIGKFMTVHNAKNTTAHGKFVYLSKDNSKITKDIISKINKGMDNSVSSEDIRGLILGEKSNINAKPILIIDCDDVHASHGCAIGTVDDNEVYYLMSRGLTKDEAMKIISKSLITPLLKASTSIDFNNVINPYLEKMIEA